MTKLKIGITGGIGSGKSFCARYFHYMGIPYYDADERAKGLMQSDPAMKDALRNLLGKNVYKADGNLNKPFLRDQLFNDSAIRQSINGIVHPAVGRDYEEWHRKQNAPFTLKEAALLVESGSYKSLDHLIVVLSPLVTRIQRVMQRDQVSADTVRQRMKSQWPEEEKAALSDSVIDNGGTQALLAQIMQHYIMFKKSSS